MPTEDFAVVNADDSKTYLGDGVYASFDGFNVWLTIEPDSFSASIALEPAVFDALVAYRAELKRKFIESGHLPRDSRMLG